MISEKGFKYLYRCLLLFGLLLAVGGIVFAFGGSIFGLLPIAIGILMLTLYDMALRIRNIQELLKRSNFRKDEENNRD